MKIACFDIETWDLSPEFAPLVCASVLDVGSGEMTTYRMDSYRKRRRAEDYTDDRALLCDLRDLLNGYNLLMGWNSKGFDIPLIQTRLSKWGEEMLQPTLHVDAMWAFRGWHGLKPRSSKLKHVSEFFGFEEKPELDADVWLKARGGNKAAIDEVVDRCEADVRITAEITQKAFDLGLIRNIQRYP